MWICDKCKTSNSDNANFCSNCGASKSEPSNGLNDSKTNSASIRRTRNILIIAVVLLVTVTISIMYLMSKSIYGYYVSESAVYSVSINKDGSCNWYQDGIRFDGNYERENDHLTLYLTGNGHYASTVFSANIEAHDLRVNGGTVNNELFIKQKKPDEIKTLDDQDFTVTPSATPTTAIDAVSVESSFGVTISETILLDDANIRVTALRYQETRYSSLNYEDIAIRIENNRNERIDVSVAYVRINGVTQRVYPDIYPNTYVEPHTECDGLIELDPEYIVLSGYEQIYSLEISLVVRDDNYNDILISPFVNVPIVDNRTHQTTVTPIWITLVENEHIEASVLGYSIDDRQLHLYFNLKTDDTVPGDNRYIEFLGGRDEYSSAGTIRINGVASNLYMWEIYDRQPECAFVEDIYFETPTDAIQTLEFAFVIYGVDRNTSEELRLFSSDAITLYFDKYGSIESASGTVNSYSDSLRRYYS